MTPLLAALVAIVVHDEAAMRAAPEPAASRQAVLWRGDWLEVRGQAGDFVKVYDHQRERPGYIRSWLVRTYDDGDETNTSALKAVIDYLRPMPGAESLGIGYSALFLRVAPPKEIDAEIFSALGEMAHRLALRASGKGPRPLDRAIAHHLEVARRYGIKFNSIANPDDAKARARLCYDGEAFRQVLALKASADQKAMAALGLTDPACAPDGLGATMLICQTMTAALMMIQIQFRRPLCSSASPKRIGRSPTSQDFPTIELKRTT